MNQLIKKAMLLAKSRFDDWNYDRFERMLGSDKLTDAEILDVKSYLGML